MQPKHMKTAVVGAWVLGLAAIALMVNVSSVGGWMLLVGLGVLPPFMLLRLWREPAQTTSESIRSALR